MSETDLRHGFDDLATTVRPTADPLQGVMHKVGYQRRLRVARWTVGVAAVVSAVLLIPMSLYGNGTPITPAQPSPTVEPGPSVDTPITPAIRRLIESPTRGSLKDDRALLDALHGRLQPRWPDRRITVLFAGDVGGARLVIAAAHNTTMHTGIFLHELAGADAIEMTDERHFNDFNLANLAPVIYTSYSDWGAVNGSVVLAPAGCVLEVSAHRVNGPKWTPASHGDHDIRPSDHGKDVRVTCDGVLRYVGAPDGGGGKLGSPVRDAATAGPRLRGTIPADTMGELVGNCDAPESDIPLFGGVMPGQPGLGNVYVAVCRFTEDSWHVVWDSDQIDGWRAFVTAVDLAAPKALVAMAPIPTLPDQWLLLASPQATRYEVTTLAGKTVSSGPMTAGVASLTIPAGEQRMIRAYDNNGTVVSEGVVPLPQASPVRVETIDNWSK